MGTSILPEAALAMGLLWLVGRGCGNGRYFRRALRACLHLLLLLPLPHGRVQVCVFILLLGARGTVISRALC